MSTTPARSLRPAAPCPAPSRTARPARPAPAARRVPGPRLAVASLLGLAALLASAAAPATARQAPRTAALDTALFDGLRYRSIGPFRGGRSTAVAGHAGLRYTYFMGGTGGGVWKTDDAGTNWTNLSDGWFGGSIGAIAVAPSDSNVIYVGTGSACIRGNTSTGRGAWKSDDGGRSWRFIGLPEAGQIGRIVVDPRDADRVYLAALGHPFGRNRERGVYRSKDGGASWEHVLFLNDSTGAVELAMNPRNPRILFAGMWRAERKPWTLISGGEDGGVYRTRDGGDTWHKLAGGLPSGTVGKVGVTVSAANPNRVWAIVEAEPDGGVYRSDDGGETWVRTNSDNRLRQRAWYYTHIVADPKDENTVWVLNVQMWKSVDGGRTFENVPVPHGDVHDLWINPDDPRLMVVANDGGGQVSVNGGRSWSTYHNQPTAEFYGIAVDNRFPYRVYGAQQDNTGISVPVWASASTMHPIQNWQYPGACETGPIAFHPDHPDIIWGGCYGGAINRMDLSADQRRNVIAYPQLQLGQAAKDLRHRFQWVSPIVVSPHDPRTVYHASQYVLRTRDDGMTWDVISPDLTLNDPAHQEAAGGPINHDVTGVEIFGTIFALAVSHRDANTLWAGSDDGRVHITRDGGGAWTDITPPGMPRLGTVNRIELSRHREGRAYLAVHRYRMDDWAPYIFRTDDFGRTWARIADGRNGIPADHPVRVVREDPDREGLLYAGTEFGLFVSFDDGRTWHRLQRNLPITPVVDLAVHRKDLVVSTQGRSFWVLDDISPLHELPGAAAAADAHLFQPRDAVRADMSGRGDEYAPEPPPAGATLYYLLGREPAGPVTLEVVDAQGRTVRAFTSDSAASAAARERRLPARRGTNRFNWDLTYAGPTLLEGVVVWGYTGGVKAPPGTYSVRLTADGATQTRTVRVLPDPRIPDVAQADYDEQFRVAVAVRDTLSAVHAAVATIRSVREQAVAVVARARALNRAGDLPARADSLDAKLTAIEDALIQRRSRSGQDPIRFPGRLDNQLVELYGNVTGVDGYISGGPEGRPTRGAYERQRTLNAEWTALRARLDAVLATDLAAFNAAVQAAGIPPVAVPAARPVR
jgi:photosystem II stability/assembly factor-like uncharacterized protein